MLLLLMVLLRLAVAAPIERERLDEGDRTWAEGQRGRARQHWAALEEAEDPAVRAQAAIRMLLVSGNLGLVVHGPRADRALAACPAEDPWCLVAEADYELFLLLLGLPGDRKRAVELSEAARPFLPGPALGRLVWAGELPVERLSGMALDGLGEAVQRGGGRWPAGPGTWVLGLGVVGARGLGVGGTLRLLHPDLGWKGIRLELSHTLTSRGVVQGGASLLSPGRRWWTASLAGSRAPLDFYDEGGRRRIVVVSTLGAGVAPGLRTGPLSAHLGPLLRLDHRGEQSLHGHGLFGGLSLSGEGGGARASLRAESAFFDYAHLRGALDLRALRRVGQGAIALRLLGEGAPLPSTPAFRLPQAGGGELLRSPPLGRFRAPWLAGAVAEWRSGTLGPLGIALFAEGAWVEGPHGGGGGGIRLHLPPRPHNTLRLDLAAGDAGWGLTAGWGEAF